MYQSYRRGRRPRRPGDAKHHKIAHHPSDDGDVEDAVPYKASFPQRRKNLLIICTVLLALVLLLECVYCVAVFTDWVPPLADLRDMYIETALGTMNHKWLATALIPGDIVLEVRQEMDAARQAQLGQNSSPWNPGEISENRDFFDRFPELDPSAVRAWAPIPEEELEFAMVSLDPDLYDPTYAGLRYFYPRLSRGGVIIIHDYNSYQFTGVAEAVRRYCREEGLFPVPLCDLHGTAVLRKP